ncbi:MAG: hypothetical protein QNK04_13515 [Myxococcota bacterium]|nr:hypothetical protein [Myxococcota bacterium]
MNATATLHALVLSGAFWLALRLYRGARPAHFAGALAAGAVFARVGWGLLHWGALAREPAALLAADAGYCVLFFPLGPLLLAREPAAWRALALPLALARTGCLLSGCCGGVATSWGAAPTAVAEVALLVPLHRAVRAAPAARARAAFLLGFGLVRLVVEPWRAAPPLGEPALPAALLALAWVGTGALLALQGPTLRIACLGLLAVGAWLLAPGVVDLPAAGIGRAPERHASVSAPVVQTGAPRAKPRRTPRAPARARPRFASPDPRLRAAALEANAAAWDAEALPRLIALEDDPDPFVRDLARRLVRRYLIWGTQRPTWRERRDGNLPGFEPWDRAGLRAWRARRGS